MAERRDVQNSKRNINPGFLTSSNSAVAMEIKRKKIRQSALFLQTESTSIQEKLDFETRMREGAYKLLLACSKREQVLDTSKNLLTCNARIRAYLSHLQRNKELRGRAGRRNLDERVPCDGTVAISGLRIPLMWKDQDHFNNRGSSRRVAVFCLMLMGSEVFDTKLAVVDRSVTDVCFDEVAVFKEGAPQFELRVELWSCALEEELTLANTPKKLAKKFRNSLGKASGKKLCPLQDNPDPDTFLLHNPIPPGARFGLLAHATLRLPEADGNFQSHSLVVLQDAERPSWLPLYGNLCCRLVAQPSCMTRTMMAGYLSQKQTVDGLQRCCRLYCTLSAGSLSCYFSPEEIDAKVPPTLTAAINKETRIRMMEKESRGQRSRTLSVISPSAGGAQSLDFTADSGEELEEWLDALQQHLYDQGQWLHCCDQLMTIEVVSPKKPSLFVSKQADSFYNDLSIGSPGKFEGITDIIHTKIEETGGRFLIGREEETEKPDWSTLFDGSHPVVVQRGVLSRCKTSTPCTSPAPTTGSTPASNKKRHAPPPPADREPYSPPTRPARPPPPPYQEKENSRGSRPAPKSKTGRPSLDAKFSAIIQQLQRSHAAGGGAAGRKNAPLGILDVQPQGQPPADHWGPVVAGDPGSVGNARNRGPSGEHRGRHGRSFRERMNLKHA